MHSRTKRIRELNDAFRQSHQGGTVVLTSGVDALSSSLKCEAISAVRTFNDFDGGNDPHHEHDFGTFEVGDNRLFWKIDYYGKDLNAGSEDPSDPDQTTRVLTIMLAEEY